MPVDFPDKIVHHNTLENIIPKLSWAKKNRFELLS